MDSFLPASHKLAESFVVLIDPDTAKPLFWLAPCFSNNFNKMASTLRHDRGVAFAFGFYIDKIGANAKCGGSGLDEIGSGRQRNAARWYDLDLWERAFEAFILVSLLPSHPSAVDDQDVAMDVTEPVTRAICPQVKILCSCASELVILILRQLPQHG